MVSKFIRTSIILFGRLPIQAKMAEEHTTQLWPTVFEFYAGGLVERLEDLPAGSVRVMDVHEGLVRWCLGDGREPEVEPEGEAAAKPEGWTVARLHETEWVPENRAFVPAGTWGDEEEAFVRLVGRDGREVRLFARPHPSVPEGRIETNAMIRDLLRVLSNDPVEVERVILSGPVPVARRVTCLAFHNTPGIPVVASEEGLRRLARDVPYWTCFVPLVLVQEKRFCCVVAVNWDGDGDAEGVFCCDETTEFVSK